jgi:hypothetical protein
MCFAVKILIPEIWDLRLGSSIIKNIYKLLVHPIRNKQICIVCTLVIPVR